MRLQLYASFFAALGVGCASDAAIPVPTPTLDNCAVDADCPSGLLCREAICVSPDDGLPVEFEIDATISRPIATGENLFALSTGSSTVLVIDPIDLAVRAVLVPREPVALTRIADTESVAVVSRAGKSLSVVGATPDALSRESVALGRAYAHVVVSPDGRYAVAYTPDGLEPDEGAEGLVAVVDLEALARGDDVAPAEVAAGYRHTNVFFRVERGLATLAVVVGKNDATIIELARLAEPGYRPGRIAFPDSLAEVIGREAVASEASPYVLLRALGHPGIAVLDLDLVELTDIPLSTSATDLDLLTDGSFAVGALRATNQVALLSLPDALTSSAAVRVVDVDGVRAGQIELDANGRRAAIYSRFDEVERFGLLDLEDASVRVFDRLEKKLRQVTVSPDGATAIVLHEAEPDSTAADPYERAVDQDEGYSIVDLDTGDVQLKRTGRIAPASLVFSNRHASVTLRDPDDLAHRVETIDLDRLVVTTFALGSAPEYTGAFAGEDSRVWVTQEHVAGRISILDVEAERLRTLTGYQLNARIEGGTQ
jgi:hypothetical protein